MNATVASGMLEGAAGWWADWMFQMTWQVAILVIVLSAATYLMRRRSAVFLHALWILVLVRLVLPPTFAFPTGWGWWFDHAPLRIAERSPQAAPTRSHMSPASTQGPVSDVPAADSIAAESTVPPSVELAASDLPANSILTTEPRTSVKQSAETSATGRPWATYLLLAWAGVTGTLLAMLGLGSLRVRRWVREATPLTDPALCDMLHDCCERLEVGGGIELRNSETCTTPVVVGHFQPVILLPASVLKGLDRDELRSVLIHELQHIRRGDAIFNLCQGVLGAIYFFHPLVWWANHRIRELREDACDELTVAALRGARKPYGSALLKVTEMFGYASPPLALGVMETRHPAHRRLRRILDPKLPAGDKLGWSSLVMLLAFAALLLPAGSGQTKSATRESATVASLSGTGLTGASTAGANSTDSSFLSSKSAASNGTETGNTEPGTFDATPTAKPPVVLAADLKPNIVNVPLSPALRYLWAEGRRYSYSMQIEADSKDQIETFGGTISYKVRSTTDAGADLTFEGSLAPHRRIKNPSRGFAIGPPRYSWSPNSAISGARGPAEHALHVDNQGHVENSYGDLQLPYMLGNLSRLVLVPLSGADEKWQTTEKTTVRIHTENNYPRIPFSRFAEPEEAKGVEAKEESTFVREKLEGDRATIRKQYELKSTETHNGAPKVDLSGGGTIIFDRRQGVPISLEFIATLTRTDTNFFERTPLKISARLLSEAEIERTRNEEQQAQARKPLEEGALEGLIDDLKSGDANRIREATVKLEQSIPARRQFEVAQLLEKQLDDKDNFFRQRAVRALAVWCTPENVPRLLTALDDEFFVVRWGALEALAKLKDPRAAQPIVDRYSKDRLKAAAALRALGSIAEEAVATLLTDKEWSIRNDACSILKDIGTAKSTPALDEIARRDENGLVRKTAEDAIAAIRDRG